MCKISNDKVYSYSEEKGIPAKLIYSVIDDNEGNLWLGSNIGLIRIAKTDFKDVDSGLKHKVISVVYGTADGMETTECNYGFPACTKTSDGRLWFPTIKGVVMVNPSSLGTKNTDYPVVIEKIKINSKYYN
ncbi:MAG TPA: two-component regulator propeller domain-containing protein, partial [Ignavibacteriaceae bacterium]